MQKSLSRFLKKFRKRTYPYRSLSFTRFGVFYLLFTIGCGSAATNTGNNLLYLVFSLLLSILILSGVIAEISFWDLEFYVELPKRIHAKKDVFLDVEAVNGKKSFCAYCLEVMARGDFECRPERILEIRPQSKKRFHLTLSFPKRGISEIKELFISTLYPFGLFTNKMYVKVGEKVLVYPKIFDLETQLRLCLEYDPKDRSFEFFGTRDYHPYDDARFIHWKASAALKKLVVKEFEKISQEEDRKIALSISPSSWQTDDQFELGIEVFASLVNFFVQKGERVCAFFGKRKDVKTMEDLLDFFSELALLEMGKESIPKEFYDGIFIDGKNVEDFLESDK